jgi:hypothetical protein
MHVLIPTNAAPGSSRGCGQTSVNCGDQANWASDATMQCMLQFIVSLLRLYLPGLKGIGVFNPLPITLHAALQYELCNASCDTLSFTQVSQAGDQDVKSECGRSESKVYICNCMQGTSTEGARKSSFDCLHDGSGRPPTICILHYMHVQGHFVEWYSSA